MVVFYAFAVTIAISHIFILTENFKLAKLFANISMLELIVGCAYGLLILL